MIQNYIDVYHQFGEDIHIALWETIEMMSFSMVVTLIVGLSVALLLFAFREGGIMENKTAYFVLSGLINIFKSVPFILFIITMIPVNRFLIGTGFGVDASKIPMSVIGIATFARLVEQDLLDVNKEIYETSYALGASKFQYFTSFLLVEARSSIVLSFTSASISLLSYSTVMGIIGGGGLGYLAIAEGYHNFNYKLMWIIIVMMILMVQILQTVGNNISNRIDQR